MNCVKTDLAGDFTLQSTYPDFVVTPDERRVYVLTSTQGVEELPLLKAYDTQTKKEKVLRRGTENQGFGDLCFYRGKVYMTVLCEYTNRDDKLFLVSVDQWDNVEKKEITGCPVFGKKIAYEGAYYGVFDDVDYESGHRTGILYRIDLETGAVTKKETTALDGRFWLIKDGWGYCDEERFRLDDPSVREVLPNIPKDFCDYHNPESLALFAGNNLIFGEKARCGYKIYIACDNNGSFEDPGILLNSNMEYIYHGAFVCGSCFCVEGYRDNLFVGETVNLETLETRDGMPVCTSSRLTMPDGRVYFFVGEDIMRLDPDMWNDPKPKTVAEDIIY